MRKILAIMAIILLMSAPVLAQEIDYCEGNFDYDDDQDGSDAFTFKTDFGRSSFGNPCPPDGPAPVPKTWQWISYRSGDDGDLEHGAMWPNPRFTDNGDDTITDNLTGIMWLKDANCMASWYPGFDNDDVPGDGAVTWGNALDFVAGINDGSNANCGGNQPYNDWRLPNIKKLKSLIHYGFYDPAVPCTAGPCKWQEGEPFINLQSTHYWSSTTDALFPGNAWYVDMYRGNEYSSSKAANGYYVWPVRGGQ